ncbi:unnamed protein product [Tenebrio molitor]|nr:unnamed protein product [Tenebrio molitor]
MSLFVLTCFVSVQMQLIHYRCCTEWNFPEPLASTDDCSVSSQKLLWVAQIALGHSFHK